MNAGRRGHGAILLPPLYTFTDSGILRDYLFVACLFPSLPTHLSVVSRQSAFR